MKIRMIVGAAALSLSCSFAWAETPNPLDDRFSVMASVGNAFEITSSRLALQRATRPELLAFARMMIADHVKAQRKLDALASASGADAGLILDADHQKMIDELSRLSGADFDQAYEADQIAAHQESAQLLSDYRATGEDPNLQAYVGETLPVVNSHLRRIQVISTM